MRNNGASQGKWTKKIETLYGFMGRVSIYLEKEDCSQLALKEETMRHQTPSNQRHTAIHRNLVSRLRVTYNAMPPQIIQELFLMMITPCNDGLEVLKGKPAHPWFCGLAPFKAEMLKTGYNPELRNQHEAHKAAGTSKRQSFGPIRKGVSQN